MKLRQALLIVMVALSACEKVKEATTKAKETATKLKGGPPNELVENLVGAKYAGTIGTEVFELSFRRNGDGLAGEAVYTTFGQPSLREELTVDLKSDLTIHVRGTRFKRLTGVGDFVLDDMSGSVTADGVSISGKNKLPNGALQPWSVSSASKVADLDPPLDRKRAESALLSGKWEGRMSDKPAKMVLKRKGQGFAVQIAWGGSKVSFDASLANSGVLTAKPRERPTAQGLLVETFAAQLWPSYARVSGGYSQAVRQGFVEQSSSFRFAFKDLKAPPAPK